VLYTGTHDNDTTRGWFSKLAVRRSDAGAGACSQETVLRKIRGHARSVSRDLLRYALGSPARLAIAPMQDFLGLDSEARLNVPGRAGGNWEWRLDPASLTPEFIESVQKLVTEAARD
jgi:4-alpha-glucanotransferase